MTAMTPAERFFWLHAGYSHDPKAETRAQGRRRCAVELARAEAFAAAAEWTFEWPYDESPDLSWMTGEDRQQVREVLGCVLRAPGGDVLGSLWGIVDPSRDYARVVQAELACEAMANVEESLTYV